MHNPKYSVSSGGGVTTPTTRHTFDAPHLVLVLSGFSADPTCDCCGRVCHCARKTSGRSFYFVEDGEAAFLQAAQAIAWQLEVGGPKPYSVEEGLWGISELAPLLKPRDESFLENAQKAKRSGKTGAGASP
jgi:hypothetical protein